MIVEMMANWNVSTSGSSTLRRLSTQSHGTGQNRFQSGFVHMSTNELHFKPIWRAAKTVNATNPMNSR